MNKFKIRLQNLLGIEIEDGMGIYELYDDSIKMFQVLSKVNNEFGINMGLVDLVTCDSVDDLIAKIETNCNKKIDIIGEESLSLIQQSYWLGREQSFYGDSNSTHLYLEVRHDMDVAKVQDTIRKLIKMHDALRIIVDNEKQCVLDEKIADSFCLESISISEREREPFFEELRTDSQVDIRNLDSWPLFTVKNVCIDDIENILVIDIEMIIVDGMSLQILLRDFLSLYYGKDIENQKVDYLECIRAARRVREGNQKYDVDQEYWKQRLHLIPGPPKLPECNDINGKNIYARFQKKIGKRQWDALEKIAKKNGVTVSVVLLYAYLCTLERWSEESEFTVNVTLSGRPYEIKNIEKVIGDFTTNVLFDFSKDDKAGTVDKGLKNIRNKLYEYCDHNSYEGVEVIRDMIKAGRINQEKSFPIVFTSMLFGELPQFPDTEVIYSQSQTSQVSLDNQIYRVNGGGLVVWDYLKKIYPETVIHEMFDYYCELVESLGNGQNIPEGSLEFEKKVKKYNMTEKKVDFLSIGEYLNHTFKRYGSNIAVSDSNGDMTYQKLECSLKSTMKVLKGLGVGKGKYIVVKTDKSIEAIVTILSIVLCGATYVPVERNWPDERIDYILNNASADMIIDPYEVFATNEKTEINWEKVDLESSTYVIYTSGSTGKPKGVEIAYKSMLNTVLDINDRIGLDDEYTILGLSSLCFDLSVYDIFATIFSGAHLKLVKELRDTDNIKQIVKKSSKLVWNSVPAAMELFIESLDTDYVNHELKYVLLSGDWINTNLPDKIKKHFPDAVVFSLGGATEAAIWSIYYQIDNVDPSWSSIPYGYPLANQSIYVLDQEQKICPPEVIGEIYIGGVGVAKGYINDLEKTKNSFINSEYGRLYKTGDFGKYSEAGFVVFCGRKDSQVKIGGYRIELGEIETQINNVHEISDCVAVVNDKKQIVVFYKGELLEPTEIKRKIRNTLPTYMYPHQYNKVDDFPLNSNGKIDRKMLKSIADSTPGKRIQESRVLKEKNPLLDQVVEIWGQVLNCDIIYPENDFFELGGDSIKAQRIVRKIEDAFGVKVPFLSVINSRDISEFCDGIKEVLENQKGSKLEHPPIVLSNEQEAVFPLTGVQLAYLNGRNDSFELGKYNAHYYFEVDTKYSADQIQNAIQKVIKRHDALRAIFLKSGKQKVLKSVPEYIVQVIECKNENEKEEELRQRREVLSHKIYNHEKWPLFTFLLIESDISKTLLVSLDLMVCDGDSMQILFTELADILEGRLLEDKIEYSYEQYIQNIEANKNPERYVADKSYWLNRMASFSKYPALPMKMSLTDCKEYKIKRMSSIIDDNTWKTFKDVAREHKISPSTLLCAIYGRILARWSNQNDLLLNLTVFQRPQYHKDVDKIIGDFTKLLPLNVSVGKEDIWSFATTVQEQIMTDLEHLSFDGTEIMRELAKQRGVFGKALLPVVFTCVLFDCQENYFERLGKVRYAVSQTPQVFLDNQITEMSGKLHISWDIVKELFDESLIDEIFSEFVNDIKMIGTRKETVPGSAFAEEAWRKIVSKSEFSFKGKIPQMLKSVTPDRIRILDYGLELCPPEVIGEVYFCIKGEDNEAHVLNHPVYGKIVKTDSLGVLRKEGYLEFISSDKNCMSKVKEEKIQISSQEIIEESSLQKRIIQIWKDIFETEEINGQDDFYTLGGDSIILMRLVDDMNLKLGCSISVDDILQSENISELSKKINM